MTDDVVDDGDVPPGEAVPGQVVVVAGPAPLSVLTGLVDAAAAAAGLPAGEPFSAFLAMDYRATDPEQPQAVALSALVERCLERGVFAVATWGPRCEVVHDIVDGCDVWSHIRDEDSDGEDAADDPDEDWPVVMTTWHSRETVEQALRYFVGSQIRDERKPGGRLALVLLDEDVDAAPVLAWLERWHIPFHRLTGSEPVGTTDTSSSL